jgi:hypothetical protein
MKFLPGILPVLLFLVTACGPASGQKTKPPDGYYPPGYNGDAWKGRVLRTKEDARSLTLIAVVKGKGETFVGVIEKGYLVEYKDGSIKPLKVSKIPVGMKLTVFYEQRTKKVNGKKVHYNLIIDMVPLVNRKKEYRVFRGYS